MKTIIKLSIVFIFLISMACNTNCTTEQKADSPSKVSQTVNSDYLLMSTLWFQKSAEMQAVYLQTYHFAKLIIDKKVELKSSDKPKAVVVDIDETVLDNSPFEAHCITGNTSYTSKEWKTWTDKSEAKALPGALDFLNYAKEKGVETIYISNRKKNTQVATLKNLQNLDFPFADDAHLFLRDSVSTKRYRREAVLQNYNVILYIGDNLTDYSEIFENRDSKLGKDLVNQNKDILGEDFLILPNPMYGEWEKPIFNNNMRIPDAEKDSLRKSILDTY